MFGMTAGALAPFPWGPSERFWREWKTLLVQRWMQIDGEAGIAAIRCRAAAAGTAAA